VLSGFLLLPATAHSAAALLAHRASLRAKLAATELPPIVSTGARVRALWQVPLIEATLAGNVLVGLLSDGPGAEQLRAISLLTGGTVWTTALGLSRSEFVLKLLVRGDVAVVQIGRIVGRAGFLVTSRDVVFDATSGRELWSTAVTTELRGQPIAYSAGLIVMADASGALAARDARTGAARWRSSRPRACPALPGYDGRYDSALAADGGLLVASYRCQSPDGGEFVLVRRLAPRSGAARWGWTSRGEVSARGRSFIDLGVVAAAKRGGVVLLSGQAARARRLARRLPRPHAWPTQLGPSLDTDLILALDARSGRPRWSELGGQLPAITLSDGLTCESDELGFECRDDRTGRPSCAVVRTARTEADSPPYRADGYAGIGGERAGVVTSQAPGGALAISILQLRGHRTVARATVQLGDVVYGGANFQSFIVGGGELPRGSTLLLLRRVDLPGYPLVALSVSR
jgi:hypothetical protein